MPPDRVSHTDLAGTSRLFGDYVYHFDRVRRFYRGAPLEPASFRQVADSVDFPPERRRALVEALRGQNGDSAELEALSRPGTCAVVTGQQVGLFLGPCYTIYKALTAVRLARRLTAQGLPCVPVFWLATEDHDYEEVNHCWVLDSSGSPCRIALAGAGGVQQPVGGIAIQSDPCGDLRRALGDLPFAAEVMSLAEKAYAPHRRLGAAFRDLLRNVLSSYGLLCLDPLDPAIREIASPVLARAAGQAPALVQRVISRGKELEEAGYHAQVHVETDSTLLFLLEGGRRIALHAQAAAKLPTALSPNALLRPVVQDYLLPTVASVMGPAEVAYMAQAQVLYEALDRRMPVVVPRSGFTLLDGGSGKLMDRYELTLGDLSVGEEALRERIARQLVPPSLHRSLESAKAETDSRTAALTNSLVGYDPTLAEAMERSRRKILYQLGKIERKVAREALRRDERATVEAARLSGLVYPHRHLQERFYSMLPFLARHGLELIDRIYEEIDLDSPDHRVLTVRG